MKVFISADIEGTNGIADWDETEYEKPRYAYFAAKMTDEVGAVCKGINRADNASEIYVKDAHGSGRNLDHQKLPRNVILNRGWARNPYSMMDGIDSSYDASIFTGYHSAAGCNDNPLAHTMNGNIAYLKINDRVASECLLNYYSSLYKGVPLVMITGDEGLCAAMKNVEPNLYTVVSFTGRGTSVTSIHPDVMLERFEETAQIAVENRHKMSVALPSEFKTEVCFYSHVTASRAAYYPGAYAVSPRSVGYTTTDYFEFLRFFMFVNV